MNLTNIIILLGIALVLFGPEDLPKIARTIGKAIYTIRKYTSEFTKQFGDITGAPEKILMNAFDEKKPTPASTINKVQKKPVIDDDDDDDDDDDEILTYDDATVRSSQTGENQPAKPDPLADLPSDMVSYEKEQVQAGDRA